MITADELAEAGRAVYAAMGPTLARAWPLLAEATGAAEVWVKHENHTPTGAFKVRGGLSLLARLAASGRRPRGLITATRGNHGQSIPFAAALHGIPVTVVVPHGNSAEKNAAMRALGARLIEHGENFDAARQYAEELAEAEGLEMVPSFSVELVAGVATAAREFLAAAGELDAVYVPIGMGSGICAMIAVRDMLGHATEVIGVVAEGAPAYLKSFQAGRPVSAPVATFADGLAVGEPHPEAVGVINAGAARIVAVSDEEIAEAVRLLWRATHNLAEGAGAAALAAILRERDRLVGRRVGFVLTGGNLDTALAARLLAGETPQPF
jgi:threonine dehydratase